MATNLRFVKEFTFNQWGGATFFAIDECFTDAFDVFYGDDINTIYERYVDLSHSVIFGAEMYIWPDETLAPSFPKSKTPYRFLNSGTIMGRVRDLNNILRYKNIKNDDEDQ